MSNLWTRESKSSPTVNKRLGLTDLSSISIDSDKPNRHEVIQFSGRKLLYENIVFITRSQLRTYNIRHKLISTAIYKLIQECDWPIRMQNYIISTSVHIIFMSFSRHRITIKFSLIGLPFISQICTSLALFRISVISQLTRRYVASESAFNNHLGLTYDQSASIPAMCGIHSMQ